MGQFAGTFCSCYTQNTEIVVSNTQKNFKKFGGLNLLPYIRTV